MNPPDQWRAATGSRPMAAGTGAAAQWAACYCCGLSFAASNMVAFHRYPEQGVCVGCVAWLYRRRRPIVRRIYPILQLPAATQAWLARRRLRSAP